MTSKKLGVLATLLGTLGLCSLTQAAVVLDQVGEPAVAYQGNSTISNQLPGLLWQTFTVGVNGLLEAVDLAIWHSDTESASPPPLTVTVQTVTGGIPTGTILATVKADASLFPDTPSSLDPFQVAFTYIDVSAFGILVAVGDRLAITAGLTAQDLTNAGCSTVGTAPPFCPPSLYQWAGSNDDFYGNGTAGRDSTLFTNSDFGFRTYVRVPEPATLALFGLGLAGIGAVRRKKLAA